MLIAQYNCFKIRTKDYNLSTNKNLLYALRNINEMHLKMKMLYLLALYMFHYVIVIILKQLIEIIFYFSTKLEFQQICTTQYLDFEQKIICLQKTLRIYS